MCLVLKHAAVTVEQVIDHLSLLVGETSFQLKEHIGSLLPQDIFLLYHWLSWFSKVIFISMVPDVGSLGILDTFKYCLLVCMVYWVM